MTRRKCDWCPNETKDAPACEDPDGYYQAWDWYVCRSCFLDLESPGPETSSLPEKDPSW